MKYKKRVNSEKKGNRQTNKIENKNEPKKQKTQRSNKPQYYKYYTIVIKFSIFVFICELIVKLHWLHPCCDISTDTGIIKLCTVCNSISFRMPYFGQERKNNSVSFYELPHYWQDGSVFKKSLYRLLALCLIWQCLIFLFWVHSQTVCFLWKILLSIHV